MFRIREQTSQILPVARGKKKSPHWFCYSHTHILTPIHVSLLALLSKPSVPLIGPPVQVQSRREYLFYKSPISWWAVCSLVPLLCPFRWVRPFRTLSQHSTPTWEELNFLLHCTTERSALIVLFFWPRWQTGIRWCWDNDYDKNRMIACFPFSLAVSHRCLGWHHMHTSSK